MSQRIKTFDVATSKQTRKAKFSANLMNKNFAVPRKFKHGRVSNLHNHFQL